jgi:hypothetical protein
MSPFDFWQGCEPNTWASIMSLFFMNYYLVWVVSPHIVTRLLKLMNLMCMMLSTVKS